MTITCIEDLLANNEAFVARQPREDASYFDKLAEGQHPEFLCIGCSDSRVPPDRITGLSPGKPYVHGWVFDVGTGYIRPHTAMINSDAAIRQICKFSRRAAECVALDAPAFASSAPAAA